MTQKHGCDVYPHVVGKALDGLDAMSTDAAPSDWMQLHIAAEVAAIDAAPEPKALPWCEQCNLPMDICRGHDRLPSPTVETIVILWQQLDAMQECDLAAAMVRANELGAEGFHMALGMALEAVRSPRYVGEDAATAPTDNGTGRGRGSGTASAFCG